MAFVVARFRSLSEPQVHDRKWLLSALQLAIELELSTIPPYLCAYWSIDAADPSNDLAGARLLRIAMEEMAHMGAAANLLVAIGGRPALTDLPGQRVVVPVYPAHLPANVDASLVIDLGPLGAAQLAAFLDIETPEDPIEVSGDTVELPDDPENGEESYATIGEFYDAILGAFETLHAAGEITIDESGQVEYGLGIMTKVKNMADVAAQIDVIKRQGEGTAQSPFDAATGATPAHYYSFNEIYRGGAMQATAEGGWFYDTSDHPVPMPPVHALTGVASADASERFDRLYSRMLDGLHAVWNGSPDEIGPAIAGMYDLTDAAKSLMRSGVWPRFAYVRAIG